MSDTDDPNKSPGRDRPGKEKEDARKARAAQQLRANLGKRKQQQRDRSRDADAEDRDV